MFLAIRTAATHGPPPPVWGEGKFRQLAAALPDPPQSPPVTRLPPGRNDPAGNAALRNRNRGSVPWAGFTTQYSEALSARPA